MSVNLNFENKVNYPQTIVSPVVVPQNADESSLLSALDQLNQKKQELLSSLRAVEEQEAQIRAQLTQLKTSEAKVVAVPTVVKQAVKVDEVAKTVPARRDDKNCAVGGQQRKVGPLRPFPDQ